MASSHIALISLLLIAVPCSAQSRQSRLELFGSAQLSIKTVEGTFTTDYVPPLANGGTAVSGRGGQTLNLDADRPIGWLAGANWLLTPHAGVQVFVGRASHAIGGPNDPHRIQLTYLSRQPPDFIEREFTYDRSFDGLPTTGTFALWRIGTNGLWRLPVGRADLTLSGGVLFSRLQGHFDQASYFEFRLGGHSTLFYEEAKARLRFTERWHVGYNAGAEIAVPVARRVAITAGIRLMSSASDQPIVVEVLNADQMIFQIPQEQVQEHLGTQPARFTRWAGPVMSIGVRVR